MKKLLEILLQIIPIAIGVYLGFVVSNWDQNRKNQQRLESFIENIIVELNDNKEKIKHVFDYHLLLRDSSYSLLQLPPESIQKPKFFKGLQMPRLMNSAYQTGVQTGILNDLPVNKIQSLNQLYSFQDIYNDFNNMVMTGLLKQVFSDQPEDLYRVAGFINTTMNDVVEIESALLEYYSFVELRLLEE